MTKVKILKPVGAYQAGQEIEVDDTLVAHLCDGVKAMKLEDYKKLEDQQKDPKNLTVLEMHQLGVKNVASPINPDHEVIAKCEAAALKGKPVASGAPLTTTGGVTPPTTVFPALAKAAHQEVTAAEDVKPKKEKAEDKKPEEKKK